MNASQIAIDVQDAYVESGSRLTYAQWIIAQMRRHRDHKMDALNELPAGVWYTHLAMEANRLAVSCDVDS